jgi:hypothetical protein
MNADPVPEVPANDPARDPQEPRFSRFGALAVRIVIVAIVLIPCVWQTRIHAGELSSHVYNAWLAGQVEKGAVQGVTLAPITQVSTNVLIELAVQRLLAAVGPAGAQRMVVASAVLIFFWGAFFLVEVTSGRRPWLFCPILSVLSYGLVFHFGFLDFYLSTGLSFWILGLLWRPSWSRVFIALPLIAVAILAHVFPVLWALSVLAYLHIVGILPGAWKLLMPAVGLAGLMLIQTLVRSPFRSWSWDQMAVLTRVAGILGVDQVWLYDTKYLIAAAIMLLLWVLLFLQRLDQGNFFTDPKVHIWFMHLAAFALMPPALQFPRDPRPLALVPQCISLFTAIAFCMMAGKVRYGRGITRVSILAAAIFFTFLNLDDRAFNRAEDEVTGLVAALPPGQRVVASIDDSGARINALNRVADRACIGLCFSYGDYEPAMGVFRIRVPGPNPVVASSMTVVQEIEEGRHIVTPAEAPLYSVCACAKGGNRFCLRVLHAGEQTCEVSIPISPRLWGASATEESGTASSKGSVPDSRPPRPHTSS